MKRLAIFVEGQTEQLFVRRLLCEIAGEKNVSITELKSRMSKKGNRSFTVINATSDSPSAKYYVLIYDSGSDSQVKSDIVDNYDNLSRSAYEKIIGLRDVYPVNISDIDRLERGLRYGVKTKPIPVNIILAVMEIEAWFLGETTHFTKIHSALTLDRITRLLNFDPTQHDVESRACPSDDLHNIYQLEGLAYTKKRSNCLRTVNALDCNVMYLGLSQTIKSMGSFIKEIDAFFS